MRFRNNIKEKGFLLSLPFLFIFFFRFVLSGSSSSPFYCLVSSRFCLLSSRGVAFQIGTHGFLGGPGKEKVAQLFGGGGGGVCSWNSFFVATSASNRREQPAKNKRNL